MASVISPLPPSLRPPRPSSRERSRRGGALVVAVVLVLGAVACGGEEDPGDPDAFCDLLRAGVGFGTEPERLDELEAVAPPDIRVTVRQLANTARSLDQIPDQNLDELFSAAFDPEAIEARAELRRYAVDSCGSPAELIDEPGSTVSDQDAADAAIVEYLANNFRTTAWVDDLDVTATLAFGRLESVQARFFTPPASPDDALAACNALAVYLYEIHDGTGEVNVELGDTLLAGRSGPDAPCVRP